MWESTREFSLQRHAMANGGIRPRGRVPMSSSWLSLLAEDMAHAKMNLQQLQQANRIEAQKWKQHLKERLFLFFAQPSWRANMEKKVHLTSFAAAVPDVEYECKQYEVVYLDADGEEVKHTVEVKKKVSTFAPFLRDSHRRRRQFLLTFRAGGLPLQCAPQGEHLDFYRRGGRVGSQFCFMCNGEKKEGYAHFVNACPAYQNLRSSCLDWSVGQPLGLVEAIRDPRKFEAHLRTLFQMWSLRQQCWRRCVPKAEQKLITFI
jgi:hypothetical protein